MQNAQKAPQFILALLFLVASSLGQAGHGQGRLSGIVVGVNAEAIASAKITIRLLQAGIKASYVYRHPSPPVTDSVVFETTTDKKGVWNFAGLATGVWEVSAFKEGYDNAKRWVLVRQLSDNPRVKLCLTRQIEERTGSFSIAPDLLEQANSSFALSEFTEALSYYRQYLERDPESIMAQLAVGDCLRELGRIDEAIEVFQHVVDKTSVGPGDKELEAYALIGLGESHFKRGGLEDAVKYWKLAVDLSDLNPIPAANLGEIFFSQGKLEEAVRYYQIALKIAPEQADIHYKLGLVYVKLGDPEKARERFSEAIKLEPRSELAGQARRMIKELAQSLRKKSDRIQEPEA